MGGMWQVKIVGKHIDTLLSADWKKYSLEYTVEKINAKGSDKPAIVMWTEEPATIWLHDFEVKITR